MKGRMALLLSLGAGLLAAVAVALYLRGREASLLEQAAIKDVVVASQDILANTVIDERVIRVAKVPQKYLQPGAVTNTGDVVGRVAVVPIPKDAQIIGTALEEGGREALAFQVPRGMRAVTLAVSDVTGVAGLVRPGNFVDVVGTFEYGVPSGSAGGQITYSQEKTETLTLAQNVQIVAVGGKHRRSRPTPRPAAGTGPEEERQEATPEDVEVQNVTVLVNPAQVQEMVLAQQVGTLTLSLRSNLDAGQVVDLGRIDPLTMLKVPVPVKSKPQPSWREIRGSQQF